MRRIIILSASVAALVIAPGAALADSPSQGGYNSVPIVVPPGPIVKSASATRPVNASVTATKPVSGSSLPFTGLDLGVVALLAVGLLGLGVGLRRVTRTQDN
ncbi:MAG: hypothetical protein QOG68_2753 [Solirubrobacteraceae bacterium]|jgi:hypothetical protein|nr:hypothetical protein [Solirubrobacteraceae bacterium]